MPDQTEPNLLWRLGAVEEDIRSIRETAVSREWLEERLGRIDDSLKGMSDDIREMKDDDKARRRAVFTAVVGSLAAVTVSLIQLVPPL